MFPNKVDHGVKPTSCGFSAVRADRLSVSSAALLRTG